MDGRMELVLNLSFIPDSAVSVFSAQGSPGEKGKEGRQGQDGQKVLEHVPDVHVNVFLQQSTKCSVSVGT